MTMFRSFLVAAACCAGVAAAHADSIPDSTIADPELHQIVLENEHVRVLQGLAAAGRKSPMHSHPPFLLVSLGTARVKFTYPDGKTQILDIRPGTLLWLDGVEHSWELLAGDLNVMAIEVKSAKAAKVAKGE